jgi:hypothetical protein
LEAPEWTAARIEEWLATEGATAALRARGRRATPAELS